MTNMDPPTSVDPKQQQAPGEKTLRPILLEKLHGALDGYCTMLIPTPVTNCGYDDHGGWMDKIGVTAVGLQLNMDLVPTEVFLSNTAYSHPSIPTVHYEYWPPIDDFLPTGAAVSKNDLMDFLQGYLLSMENDNYGVEGRYTYISGPEEIIPSLNSANNNKDDRTDGNDDDDDNDAINHGKPTTIIQMEHEIPVMPDPLLPGGTSDDALPSNNKNNNRNDRTMLTKQKISLLHFGKKQGIVILRANNLCRLEELLGQSLHYESIRDSIVACKTNTATTKFRPKNDVYGTMASFFARARRHRQQSFVGPTWSWS